MVIADAQEAVGAGDAVDAGQATDLGTLVALRRGHDLLAQVA